MSEQDHGIGRSERFIITSQLEGVCAALRVLVQAKEKPTEKMVSLVNRLQIDVREKILRGAPVLEAIPEVSNKSSIGELLLLAEILRATMMAFLVPEEVGDITKSRLGFYGSA